MSYVAQSTGEIVEGGARRRRFASGGKPAPGLRPGVFPAFMADFDDENTYETVEGKFGTSVKINYGVLLISPGNDARMFEINELASDVAAVRSKLVSRAAAVTPGITVTEETDLGDLNTSGWCLVELEEDPKNEANGTNFLRIKNVMQLPAGMADRLPPVEVVWDDRKNKVSVRLAKQRALSAAGVNALASAAQAAGNPADLGDDTEPPF